MTWTRDLAEEAKVNGRVRKSFWRSQDRIEVEGIRLDVDVDADVDVDVWWKCRWNGVDIWIRKKVYARRNRQPTRVIWKVNVFEVGVW